MMPELNKELLERVLKWVKIEHEREEDSAWQQDRWVSRLRRAETSPVRARIGYPFGCEYDVEVLQVDCGTAFCVAGHTCSISGDRFVALNEDDAATGTTTHVLTDDNEIKVIQVRAAKLLGLTDGESSLLFHWDNTYEEVVEIAQGIAERRGVTLAIE